MQLEVLAWIGVNVLQPAVFCTARRLPCTSWLSAASGTALFFAGGLFLTLGTALICAARRLNCGASSATRKPLNEATSSTGTLSASLPVCSDDLMDPQWRLQSRGAV